MQNQNFSEDVKKKILDFLIGILSTIIISIILPQLFAYFIDLLIMMVVYFFKKEHYFIIIGILSTVILPLLLFGACEILIGTLFNY
jgi:hypothetical protein